MPHVYSPYVPYDARLEIRLSGLEKSLLEEAAWRGRLRPSEWCRRVLISEASGVRKQAPLEPRRDPDELVIPADLAKRLKALTPLDPLDLIARFVTASEAEKLRRSA